jgi:serine/threonine protein kinase
MLTLPISGVCARRACVAAMMADSRGSGKRKMSTNIGPFEILSELAKSPTGAVYKANDPDGGQTIALKVIQLSAFGDSAAALEQALLAEAESTKALSSPNITPVFGAGVFDGQFCAAMEYVQGNSIATMLARKEGFSIWDLLDIGRQLGAGFDYAFSQGVVHYSLEPAKIMCGWDGTVRILSFGVSSAGIFAQHVSGGIPACLHYMSPEQVRGEPTDGRSNLFSLGAMLYEMVTERKAFDREDIEGLRQCILESTPVAPVQVSPKVHPLLSDLIMKALAKDPAERYQTGRQLLDDLEKCKESKPVAAKKAEAPKAVAAPKPNPAAQAKFASSAPAAAKPVAKPAPKPAPTARPAEKKLDSPASVRPSSVRADAAPMAPAPAVSKLAVPRAAAAAAGAGADATLPSQVPEIDLSNSFLTADAKATFEEPQVAELEISNPTSEYQVSEHQASEHQIPSASMSAGVLDEPQVESEEPAVETFEPQVDENAPRVAVDPMMAEGGQKSGGGISFSEMTELPPLKEVYIPPPPPPAEPVSFRPAQSAGTSFAGSKKKEDEKPKIQPREVAQKAIKEIKGVPPKLMLYAVGGAVALILAIGIGMTIYIHGLSGDDDAGAPKTSAAADTPAQSDASQPAPEKSPAPTRAAKPEPEQETPVAEPAAPVRARSAKPTKKVVTPAPVIPGQIAIDSTPQGAQVQIDGKSDPSYVTPFVLTNLEPGQHSITVSKAGYSTDTRAVAVTSANRTTTVIHLAQLMATLIVKSDPPGANIYVDGRDVGTKTPAQVSVDKGQHVVLVRMSGYIDETMNAQFALGQTFNFAPALRSLGNTDSIKAVGKMSKLFGGKGADAGQAILTIHTQPKGAQIAINQHMLDKGSPVDVALDPGNYVIDITQSGYAPIHKVISVDKGGKAVIDEVMQRQ